MAHLKKLGATNLAHRRNYLQTPVQMFFFVPSKLQACGIILKSELILLCMWIKLCSITTLDNQNQLIKHKSFSIEISVLFFMFCRTNTGCWETNKRRRKTLWKLLSKWSHWRLLVNQFTSTAIEANTTKKKP